MKRFTFTLFVMFTLLLGMMVGMFTSCAIFELQYEIEYGRPIREWQTRVRPIYEERKAEYIAKIESALASDMEIHANWLNYFSEKISDEFGFAVVRNRFYRDDTYHNNFRKTVVSKYQPLVEQHNKEWAIKQAQKEREWAILVLKRIPGNKDWIEYQDRYNIKTIYSGLLNNSNEVNRLRLGLLMKEMSDYKKNKNLVFNKEQVEWESNNVSELFKLGLLLNPNLGGTYAQVQSHIEDVLYLLRE